VAKESERRRVIILEASWR